MTITARVDAPARLGLRLARASGRTVGWIDAPSTRSQVFVNWDGSLGGRHVRDGAYQVVLVANGRAIDRAGFRLDGTPGEARRPAGREQLEAVRRRRRAARDDHPEPRRRPRLRARPLRPDRAREVHARASSAPRTATETISTHTWEFGAGPHSVGWVPATTIAARTYVLSLTTTDAAGNTLTYGSPDARVGRHPRAPVVRVMGIDAAMTQAELRARPGRRAARSRPTSPRSRRRCSRQAPSRLLTYADNLLEGVAVTSPSIVDWSTLPERAADAARARSARTGSRASTSSGSLAADGTVGYAPFVVRPADARRAPHAWPWSCRRTRGRPTTSGTRTGTAGATRWYVGFPNKSVARSRPFLRRGVPPFFYRYDQGFLHWLYWTGKKVDFLAETRPRRPLRRRSRPRLRPRRLPGTQRVRDHPRVRRDRAVSQPRWQPDLPLGEQLLLAGRRRPGRRSRGRRSGATSAARRRR